MNLELDDDQREIIGAVESLLERHAGPARAIELARKAAYDHDLDAALSDAGFDGAMDPESKQGALEASLIVEADRKSTRLNSSHVVTSYAVFCLKEKKQNKIKEKIRSQSCAT